MPPQYRFPTCSCNNFYFPGIFIVYLSIFFGVICLKKTSFIFGTIMLTLVNIFIRSLGFIYKILLSRLIGATAIGIYQMVYPILSLLIAIPTSGIPLALSKQIAQEKSLNNQDAIYKTLFIALSLTTIISLSLSVLVSYKIDFIVNCILKNSDLYYPVLWTIPSISIISFSSILRSFFYGLNEMVAPAYAQIIEQLFRIVFVLSFLYYKTPTNPIAAATIAIIGILLGEVCGLIYLILKLSFKKNILKSSFFPSYHKHTTKTLQPLLFVAIPITLSRLISVIMQTANSILIPRKLQLIGYSAINAIGTFGKISGMAMPLLYLPFTVTNALVLNLVPSISKELAINNLRDVQQKSSLALRITLLVAIPTTFVYVIFGPHICHLVYGHKDIGNYLSIISLATIFLCMQHTLSGILHGMGRQIMTTIHHLLGMGIQLYCTYFLIANPRYGLKGYFIGFFLSTFLTFSLNFLFLVRHIKLDMPIASTFIKPIIASLSAVVAIIYSYKGFFIISANNLLSSIVSFTLGAFSYLLVLIVTNAFDFKYLINTIRN